MMVASTNVKEDLKYEEILEYLSNEEVVVCEKLDKPVGGEVFVCENTENGRFHLSLIAIDISMCDLLRH